MSDERRPNAIWRFRVAGENGTKLLRIELFKAAQWKFGARRAKRNMYPAIPFNADGYWDNNYRLRINGRWRQKAGYRFRGDNIWDTHLGQIYENEVNLCGFCRIMPTLTQLCHAVKTQQKRDLTT